MKVKAVHPEKTERLSKLRQATKTFFGKVRTWAYRKLLGEFGEVPVKINPESARPKFAGKAPLLDEKHMAAVARAASQLGTRPSFELLANRSWPP